MEKNQSSNLTRREMLRGFGTLAAVLAMPSTSLLDFSIPSSDSDPVNQIIEHVFGDAKTANPFVAYAAEESWVKPVTLRNSVDAFIDIYSTLGLAPNFSNVINYREASQCRNYFKQSEANLRVQFNWFTNIERVRVERDIAYMLGGNFSSGRLYAAQGSTQFRDRPAVALADDDPAVMLAHAAILGEQYGQTEKEKAHRLALTSKRQVRHDGEAVGTYYETPASEFVHISRPPRNSRATRYPRGIIGARKKSDSQNQYPMYFAGLYV